MIARTIAVALVAFGCGGPAAAKKKSGPAKSMSECTKTIGPADAAGLQDLLDELPEGAVVCFKPGTYPGRLVLQKSVTLRGVGAAGEVILDAEGHGSLLKANEKGMKVVVERMTLTGGAPKGGGGGVAWNKVADLTLRDVILSGNSAPKFGGGAIEASLGTVTLERCRVEGNRAPIGAAILAHQWVKLTLRDTVVAGNEGESSVIQIGGGAEARIERSTVAGNRGRFAVVIEGGQEQAPVVEVSDSILSAGAKGGLIANDFGQAGKVTVKRSVMFGTATMVQGEGDFTPAAGAAYGDAGEVKIGDPLLGEDRRPGAGSPAIGIAAPPTAGLLDANGVARAGRPATAGALEPAK